jgi:hypothetical protein
MASFDKYIVSFAFFFYKFALCSNLIFQNPLESGTDEAGRGCLAGPVTAAVILPADFKNNSE